MQGDYIKLSRKMLNWEWYKNNNTKILFLHCLLKANWKDGKFEGKEIKRGELVTSLPTLAFETGLTVRQIRTALNHLKTTGELTVKTTSKYSVITVNNYNIYQSNDRQNDSQVTVKRQAEDSQVTTIEECKNLRREKGKKIVYTCAFEEFWKAYPRKKDKGNAFKKFNARLNSGFSETGLIEAAKKYAEECVKNGTEEKYIKHAATFLGDTTPFIDYLDKKDGGGNIGYNGTDIDKSVTGDEDGKVEMGEVFV